jgi:hypothetical protein
MSNSIKTDDVIFNFFKQICDEKDDQKCVELGNNWINAMETNLDNMEANLDEADKIKHQSDIRNNRDHLNNLKGKNSAEWREYATQCMVEIMDNKTQIMSNQEKVFIMICVSLIIFTLYYLADKYIF